MSETSQNPDAPGQLGLEVPSLAGDFSAVSSPQPSAMTSSSARPRVAAIRPLLAVPHLDRDFEYAIPDSLAQDVRFGVAVKVRFGGQDVSGYVVDVRDHAEHPGELKPLRRLVSATPVLTPQVWECVQAVAARTAGTVSDVLRLAIPPRHAAAEKSLAPRVAAFSPGGAADPQQNDDSPAPTNEFVPAVDGPWRHYAGGHALLSHLAAGDAPSAAWTARPGAIDAAQDWPAAIAHLVAATRHSGRGSLIVVPNARDAERVRRACVAELGESGIVQLIAEDGPSVRYTAFLEALHAMADVVVGTRAAMFAPVKNLGLVLWWDDVDALHVEPRAPYPHVRDVLDIRARQANAALVAGGLTRSVAVQDLVSRQRLMPVEPIIRSGARVVVTGDDAQVERSGLAARARIPAQAWAGARRALQTGPVLVQVPRRGYIPALACTRCRGKATCSQCHGPVGLDSDQGPLRCTWCGHIESVFTCGTCGAHAVRSLAVGAGRTAEELGRAFVGVPVRRSGSPHVLDEISTEPALVIATPGAEPFVEGGYAAAILLDAWAFLDRRGLASAERSLTAWSAAGALVRPAERGGEVFLCGVPRHTTFPEVEALVRWAPGWFAERQLAERHELLLPPATRMAALEGDRRAVQTMADDVRTGARAVSPKVIAVPRGGAETDVASDPNGSADGLILDVFGPLPLGRRHAFDRATPSLEHGPRQGTQIAGGADEAAEAMRYLVRWSPRHDEVATKLLHDVRATRSAKREPAITVRVDPVLDAL